MVYSILMELERFRRIRKSHEHPFFEEWAWAEFAAKDIINNNSLTEVLGLTHASDSILFRLGLMERVLRERMYQLQRKPNRISTPRIARRIFNLPPVNIGLCQDAANHLVDIRERFIELKFSDISLTNKAHNITYAANDLFRRFQEQQRMVLGPAEYVDSKLLESWGDAWRPRIKGIV